MIFPCKWGFMRVSATQLLRDKVEISPNHILTSLIF